MEPDFLTLDEVVRIHQDQLARYGGTPGLRDAGLLESAVHMPRAAFGGERMHTDLFEAASAYLFHLASNHPFIDGNKRTGAAAAIVFLHMNGVEVEADEEGLEAITLAVACGRADKSEVADFFRRIGHDREGR